MQAWIEAETQGADFGDERLDERYRMILDQLSDKPSLSIPAACPGLANATATYRFCDNVKTDAASVLRPHRAATLERVRAERVVITAQDTTQIDLTRKQERVGGPLNDTAHWGLYVHPVLAMTPQRVPLGVLDATMWSRDAKELEKSSKQRRRERRIKPFEEKESCRWLRGFETACRAATEAPETQVVSVSDSEGDIYECFLAGDVEQGRRADWIVRGCQDRILAGEEKSLLQSLACQAALGKMTVAVSKRGESSGDGRKRKQARDSRTAKVTVRAARLRLSPPPRSGKKLPPLDVNAILVREEKPPASEEPIEWLLITSLPIATFAEVSTVIDYYCCRWEIEIYFRVLKSGCKVEELQFEREDRLQVCLALYLIVAWRVLHVLMLGRECPELGCDAVLSAAEWKSVYVIARREAAPEQAPPLRDMIPMIAELGGYLGRKCDGPPGPQTMWIGLQRMRDFATAWSAFGPTPAKKDV
jgi:transposase Tn5 family protein/transposase-like protein